MKQYVLLFLISMVSLPFHYQAIPTCRTALSQLLSPLVVILNNGPSQMEDSVN